MDVSAQATMKDAAKCDKRCEWQNSANQENVERILHFLDIPESTSGSGLLAYHVANDAIASIVSWYTFMCASDVWSAMTSTVGALNSEALAADIDPPRVALCSIRLVSFRCVFYKLFFLGMNSDEATR